VEFLPFAILTSLEDASGQHLVTLVTELEQMDTGGTLVFLDMSRRVWWHTQFGYLDSILLLWRATNDGLVDAIGLPIIRAPKSLLCCTHHRVAFSEEALPRSSTCEVVAYWCHVMQPKTTFLFDRGHGPSLGILWWTPDDFCCMEFLQHPPVLRGGVSIFIPFAASFLGPLVVGWPPN